jgi:hypothetical protein
MARILLVDDRIEKVNKLQELLDILDSTGSQHTIITPITPRSRGDPSQDDKLTVINFLDQGGLENIDIIFQDHSLGNGFDGRRLIKHYEDKGYTGPIVSYTAYDWSKHRKDTSTDFGAGCTHIFPWGDKFEKEQLELLREILD